MIKTGKYFFILVLLIFCLVSCTQTKTALNGETGLLALDGSYDLYDFTDFGVWYLSLPESLLSNDHEGACQYAFKTGDEQFCMETNRVDTHLLRVILPGRLTRQAILNGKILCLPESVTVRESNFLPAIEKLILEKEAIENETNLYELTLSDYLDLKQAHQFVFDSNSSLIRPAYVKSTEENAYSLKRYYDARQMSTSKTAEGAFVFLKGLENYESYLFFDNPNRVVIEDQTVKINDPDTRDRLRQLGPFGDLSTSGNTYDITDDGNTGMTVSIKKGNLSAKYDDIHYLDTQIRDENTYDFSYTSDLNIVEAIIPHTDTDNVELIKNSRVSVAKKILLYSEAGLLKGSYNSIKETVAVSANKDTIEVTGGTYYNHAGQIEIAATELTIKSADGESFIVDLMGSDERAFIITNNASVTMKNVQINNINASTDGGAVFVENATLTSVESTFSNNTADFGAAVYVRNGGLNCITTSFTDNHSDKVGGAVYMDSGVLNCTDTTICNNRANGNYGEFYVGGGAVFIGLNALFNAYSTLISENICLKDGGGVYVKGTFNLSNSTMTQNRTVWSGGAVFVESGTLNLINTAISENYANENSDPSPTSGWGGGGLMVCRDGTVNATETSITSNSANKLAGGGISLGGDGSGTLNAWHLTLSSNIAEKYGRGLFLNGTLNAEAVDINNNTSYSGGGIYLSGGTIKTNSQQWSSLSSRQENFSVTQEAVVQAYDEALVVKVFDNLSTDASSRQMRGF